jgi:hypothetical protein
MRLDHSRHRRRRGAGAVTAEPAGQSATTAAVEGDDVEALPVAAPTIVLDDGYATSPNLYFIEVAGFGDKYDP